MADESIEDGEFWLPPQFLEDDPACDEFDSSDLSSPVESVAASGEDWSDEEDQLKKMAGLALEDDFGKFYRDKGKGWFGSGSPKSTLQGIGGVCGPRKKLPPPAAAHVQCGTEATGKASPVRMSEQVQQPSGPNWGTAKSDAGFFPQQSLSQRQLEVTQGLIQKQMIQPRIWVQPQVVVHGGLLGHEWPPLQQAHQKNNHHVTHQTGMPGTMMRTVFLGAPGIRPCTGTGVFLPRQVGCRPEPRKKQSSSSPSPVSIPGKVMQALNLKFERMGIRPQQQPRSRSRSNSSRYSTSTPKSDGARPFTGKGSGELRPVINHEVINLPQEWTY